MSGDGEVKKSKWSISVKMGGNKEEESGTEEAVDKAGKGPGS